MTTKDNNINRLVVHLNIHVVVIITAYTFSVPFCQTMLLDENRLQNEKFVKFSFKCYWAYMYVFIPSWTSIFRSETTHIAVGVLKNKIENEKWGICL